MGRTQIASDTFGSDDLAANWTQYTSSGGSGTLTIAAGVMSGTWISGDNCGVWKGAGTFANDTYSSGTIATAPSAGAEVGITLRDTSTATNRHRYLYTADAAGYNAFVKHVNDVYTEMDALNTTTTYASNDTIEAEVEGTGATFKFRQFKNGTQQRQITPSDSAHTAGKGGVNFFKATGTFTAWEAGDWAAAAAANLGAKMIRRGRPTMNMGTVAS